jgi:Ca-activated chloride channel family protein
VRGCCAYIVGVIRFVRLFALLMVALAAQLAAAHAAAAKDQQDNGACNTDAMLVFDASGSMSGDGWGYGSENPTAVSRMDKVRAALAKILPGVTRFRRVGLITYGPGPYNQCNVQLNFPPAEHAADKILGVVDGLTPAGKTPLSAAVKQAAEVLQFRKKPGVIVLITDGEETCGGVPCELGKLLHAEAANLTVHIIGIRVKGFSWTGEQSISETKCLAEQNGGLYLAVESEAELIAALEKTLGCPMVTQAPPH